MAKVKCVHCGKMVFEMASECPYCKKPIANPHAPTDVSSSPRDWKKESYGKKSPVALIAIVAIILVVAIVIFFLLR